MYPDFLTKDHDLIPTLVQTPAEHHCTAGCTDLSEAAHEEALLADLLALPAAAVEAELLRHGAGQRRRPLVEVDLAHGVVEQREQPGWRFNSIKNRPKNSPKMRSKTNFAKIICINSSFYRRRSRQV